MEAERERREREKRKKRKREKKEDKERKERRERERKVGGECKRVRGGRRKKKSVTLVFVDTLVDTLDYSCPCLTKVVV